MIVVRLGGGLGNQLFQYAFGRYLAHKHNTELKLDITSCNKEGHHSYYRLGDFNVIENFATPDEIRTLPVIQEGFGGEPFDDKFKNLPDNVCLDGQWLHEPYFAEIADIIRKEFTLKNPLGKNSAAWKEQILSTTCAVSVHVRHGDYILPLFRNSIISVEYYFKCVEELQKNFKNITVFVFSDDIEWCKENLKFNVPTEFVEGCESDDEEFYLMSLCKHNVIANSTFSWWAAWLNKNPDKIVLSPPINFTGMYGHLFKLFVNSSRDVYPELDPVVSIILYVDNSLPNINLTAGSLMNLGSKIHEIIFVDAATNNNGDLCRGFSMNYYKVTFLKVAPSVGIFSAWNKGLDVARGDYILFLSGKDFLFPNTLLDFFKINFQYSAKYLIPKGIEVTSVADYVNYLKASPNIISQTQRLEENESGEINIGGIPDKKFSLKVDATFQNLSGFAEIEIPHHQKLLALGSQGINGLVGTKFFKRKFLNENNIRFNENEGVAAELKFIVDAFMSTEKIVFVPQVFLGRLK